ncbi:MAG: DUF554 domain-containing protein [Nocardioidaceae bacterium]|nr:DUF554 domain-containing protein [Nocardioidaceae bacterium]
MFRGVGTVVNVVAVLLGSGIGVLVGHRLPQRTRDVVTDALGLVTLLVAALSAMTVTDPQLSAAVGDSAPVLIVLGSLLLGGIVGSLLGIEDRLEALGAALRRRLVGAAAAETGSSRAGDQQRFVEGFLTASLVFCVGPLTILGALSDGLGQGADQLVLKSVLDGFASIAFAASFGWGVAASALAVLAVQGSLTALGAVLGSFVPDAHLVAMTATGGVLLVGVALRLLQIRRIPVGDLLPALVLAPILVQIVTSA